MYRIALVAVMALAAQAREVEKGLAAVRQRLQSHAAAQRKLSGLHHRAALVSGTLAETAAALERAEGQDLGYLRERLLTASRSLEADFAAIEAKLAGLGLPEKTAAWREFVQHYRTRLAEVEGELASLAGPAGLGALRGPQQLNPYSYALNNPAALRDPSGLNCRIHFIIGMEPHEDGASAMRDDYFHGQMTPEKFEASLKVDWSKLHGQEYWDTANNPENYVKR